MPMTKTATKFETQTCTRCGGCGLYSYCETWGTTCFKCGFAKGVPGYGITMTARGNAAREYFMSLLPTCLAKDLQPGQKVYHRPSWMTVVEIVSPSTSARIVNGERISEGYIDIRCGRVTLGLVPEDHVYSLAPTPEQKTEAMEKALAYQETLTKKVK